MTKPPTIFKVAIVDDHESFSKALCGFLKSYPFMNVVGLYKNGEEIVNQIDSVTPDLIFMDIVMPVMGGVEATMRIIKKHPNIKIIAVSMHDDGLNVKQMMLAGAWSYVTKDLTKKVFKELMEHIVANKRYVSSSAAIKYTLHTNRRKKNDQDLTEELPDSNLGEVDPKNIHITPGERRIMKFIIKGYSHKQIADAISRSPRTVDTHKQNLMGKFNIHKTSEMVALVLKYNLL